VKESRHAGFWWRGPTEGWGPRLSIQAQSFESTPAFLAAPGGSGGGVHVGAGATRARATRGGLRARRFGRRRSHRGSTVSGQHDVLDAEPDAALLRIALNDAHGIDHTRRLELLADAEDVHVEALLRDA